MQIARAFAERGPVLFVNSIGMRFPAPGSSGAPLRRIGRKLRSVVRTTARPIAGVDLSVYTPIFWPAYSGLPGRLNDWALRTQISRVSRRLGFHRPLVIITLPTFAELALSLERSALLYNRSDRHSDFRYCDRDLVAAKEDLLFRKADAVIYASRHLYATEAGRATSRAACIGHGVDLERFSPVGEIAPEIAALPGPRVGFFGDLRVHAIDFELIEAVARALPGVQFVLGGAQLDDISALRRLPNVHLFEHCPHEEMPARWRALDVAILPYRISPWQEASEPIKLNEIAALGLPTIGTRLPAFADRGVIMCDSAQEFARAISTALTRSPSGRTIGEGLRSWQAIADQIEAIAAAAAAGSQEAGITIPNCDGRLRLGVIGTRGIGDLQGGIERYCSEFYQHLPAEQFRVTIFVRRRPSGQPRHKNTEVVYVPVPRSRFLETPLYSLIAILAAYAMRINVIHVHGVGSCLALPLARLLGMRVIVRHLGADYDRAKWGAAGKYALRLGELFCARFATVVVCLNGQIAADFAAATKRKDSVVVPNGVTIPSDYHSATLPAGIGVLPNSYLLTVSRIVPEKNIHQLIQAFLTADIPPSAKLVLVGESEYCERYARSIAQLCAGNESRILRIGTVFGAQLFALYRDARLFILPSSHEGMSFSLLEAGISGTQIIASDIAANREVCPRFGRLYPVGSETALREALEEQWRCARPASERAAQIAEFRHRFDWEKIAATMAPLLAGSPQENKPRSEVFATA